MRLTFHNIIIPLCGILLMLSGCQEPQKNSRVVVAVGDQELDIAQIMGALPSSYLSPQDSAVFADDVIRRWVYKQVLLQKAVHNLGSEQEKIDQAVEDYRTSLIIETYQNMLVEQKFNPVISNKEIEDYFADMKRNFVLQDPLVKGIYAIIPEGAADFKHFERLLTKFKEESALEIERYLYKHSGNYKVSVDNWMPLTSVKKFFPSATISDNVASLKASGLTKVVSDGYVYLLLVTDVCTQGSVAPLEYVQKDIYTILLSKKKLEFLSNMNSELYNQAIKDNAIKYYDKND